MADIVGLAGIIYAIGKDFWTYAKDKQSKARYEETEITVDWEYLQKSGLKEKWEAEGYSLRWTLPKNIESRKLDGYEILHGLDDKNKKIFILRLEGESILMGKKQNLNGASYVAHIPNK